MLVPLSWLCPSKREVVLVGSLLFYCAQQESGRGRGHRPGRAIIDLGQGLLIDPSSGPGTELQGHSLSWLQVVLFIGQSCP